MTPTHKRRWRWLALGLLVGLLVAGRVLAGPLAPAIDWWVVAAGGGPASNGNVSVDATLGQPVAGESTNGGVALGAGYWYGAQATYSLYLPVALRNSIGP